MKKKLFLLILVFLLLSTSGIALNRYRGWRNWTYQLTVGIGGLYLRDIDNTHTCQWKWNENDTANRVFNFKVNSGDRTFSLYENLTLGDGYDLDFVAQDNAASVIYDNVDFEVESTDASERSIKITSAKAGNTILTLEEDLTVSDGYDFTLLAEDTAGSIVLDKQTFEVEGEGTATQLLKLVNANNAAATLEIEGTSSAINQDVTTDATVRFGKVEIDGAGDYLDVSTNLQIIASADIVLDPTGLEVHIDGGLSVGDLTDVGDNNFKVVGTSLLEGATTFTTAGVVISAADGVMTFLGAGDGNDLNLIWDYDNHATATTIGISSGATTILDFGTIGIVTTGGITTGDITISDGTPLLGYNDTGGDTDIHASISVNLSDTGGASEDADVTFMGKVAGTMTDYIVFDADATLELISTTDIVLDPTSNDVLPGSASGDNLGNTATEWGNFYQGDDVGHYWGLGQDFSMEYDEDGNDHMIFDGTDINYSNYFSLNNQTISNLASNGASYKFDGNSGVINYGNDAKIANIFDGGGTISVWISPSSDGKGNSGRMFSKRNGWEFRVQDETAGKVRLFFHYDFNSVDGYWKTTDVIVPINTWMHFAMSYDSDSDANNPTFYINGVAYTVSSGLTEAQAPNGTRISDAANTLYLGNNAGGTAVFDGFISEPIIFNNILTVAEHKDLYTNGNIPNKYIGASQTLIVPSDDCADDDTANWTDVNGALTDNGTEYTYTVETGANVATFTDEAALTVGKQYRATVLAKDGTGAGSTVRINALTKADAVIENGTGITVAAGFAIATVEWTATETDNKVQIEIVAGTVGDNETVLFDEIECNSIGCVANYASENATSDIWYDSSGNALDGTVSGATLINANVSDLIVNDEANATSGVYTFEKSRSGGVITTADVVGSIIGKANDGTDFHTGVGKIDFVSSGTIAGNRTPGGIDFYYATDAAPSTLTKGLTLGNDGTFDVVGALTAGSLGLTGNLTITIDDPHIYYDPATGGESAWWTGVNHDAVGDDNDNFEIRQSATPGTNVEFYIQPDGDGFITGDFTITGDDLFMGTNTTGYILMADNTNYNPVPFTASSHLAGFLSDEVGSDKALFDTDPIIQTSLTVHGATDASFAFVMEAEQGADNPDTWQFLIADGDEWALQAFAGGSYIDALTIVGSTLAADFSGALTADSFVSDGLITATGTLKSVTTTGGTIEVDRNEADIQNGEVLGGLYGYGLDQARAIGASIVFEAAGTWDTGTDVDKAATEIQFFTEDGTTVDAMASPRMVIENDGDIVMFSGEAGEDYTLTMNGENNDLIEMWFEDENQLELAITSTETNAVINMLRLKHTGGTVVAGFGVGIQFVIEENDATNNIAGIIEVVWTDAGETTNADADMVFKTMLNDGATAEQLRVKSSGVDVLNALTMATGQTDTDMTVGVLANDVLPVFSIISDAENDNATPVNETYSAVLVQNANPNLAYLQWSTTQSTAGMDFDMPVTATSFVADGNIAGITYGSNASISDAELLTIDDGALDQIIVGGGAGSAFVWGDNIPTAVTIGTAYIYRVGGTDVSDGDVADDITLTNISQVADISATALEINTPLDGALVTLTEFQELETIDATTISTNQWALLGGLAETLGSAEVNILDGVTGVVAAEISYIGDVTGLIQAQLDLKAPLANPTFTGSFTSPGIDDNADDIAIKIDVTTEKVNFTADTSTGGYSIKSVTAGITAANPGNQTDGALTTDINEVSTVGADNDAVTLPSAATGMEVFIINNGANILEIWPFTDDDLGAGANTATTLAAGANVTFVAYNAVNWETK